MDILFYLRESFVFILLTTWLVLIPGYFLLNLLRVSLSKIEKFTVALASGISGFTLLLYIFGSLGLHPLVFILLSIISSFWLVHNRFHWQSGCSMFTRMVVKKSNLWSLFLITFGTFVLGGLIFRSGWKNSSGSLSFTEYRDAFWHLGLMEELVRRIPPLHPGFAPLPLTNYHYFAHLFGSGYLLTGLFNNLDFYFRLFPFLLVFLFGLSLYIAGRALTKSVLGANLSVLFGYFTGSFAYFLPWFVKYPGFDWHESSFWLSQPFSMVINPAFALSAALFVVTIFLLTKITTFSKKAAVVLLVLTGGTLIAFKVYAGLLFLGGMGVVSVWNFWQKREITLAAVFFPALLLSLVLFIPINGQDAGSFLVFLPGWFLRSMVESPDRVQIIDWILRENTYAAAGNTLAIIRYRLVELVIYLVGNLGIRVFGLAVVISLLKKIKNLVSADVYLLSAAAAGLIIPLLFVQNGSIANTVQFSYYSLIIFGLWTALFLNNLVRKYPFWIKTVLVAVFFVLAIPTSVKLWYGAVFPAQTMGVGVDFLQAFSYLQTATAKDTVVLVPASPANIASLEVGTLSQRRVYYSDRLMAENTQKNFQLREKNLQKFYHSQDTGWNTSLLKDNNISYVYVDKSTNPDFNPRYYPLTRVFSNKTVDIYQVL